MKKNANIERPDIESVGFSNLVELNNDLFFGYPADQLKSEVFWMFMAFVQSLENELNDEQKSHVFHFYRLYSFYERLEKKLIEPKI